MEERRDYPNIVFILSDALRAKDMSCYEYEKPTTPNLDKLANEGILFENAYSCADETNMSLTTIFSGLFPPTHGVIRSGEKYWSENWKKIKINGIRFLPEILRQNGYHTIGIDWLGRWHKSGYDIYTDRPSQKKLLKNIVTFMKKYPQLYEKIHGLYYSFSKQKRGGPLKFKGDNAAALTDIAIDKIKAHKEDKPFFLFIHYWDTHIPFYPPKENYENFYDGRGQVDFDELVNKIENTEYLEYLSSWTKGIKYFEEFRARYDACINFMDEQVGRLISFLKDEGLYDNTILIFTADHGQSFEKHDMFYHSGLYEEILHIPLIIHWNKLPSGKKLKGFVQHVDLVPTIFDILKLEGIEQHDGESLINLINSKGVMRDKVFGYSTFEKCIRDGDYKLIVERSGKMLFNLRLDPDEKRNIISDNLSIAKALEDSLLSWENAHKQKRVKRQLKHKISKLKL